MGQSLRLRPYQDDAADFLYERDRAMILAPVGAGKTAITLTAMQAMGLPLEKWGTRSLQTSKTITDILA